MGAKTGIEWTDSTWNPIRGCSPVSAGCKNCYASANAKRFSGPGGPFEGLVRINAAGERTDEWNGQVHFVEKHLLDPLKWKPVLEGIRSGTGEIKKRRGRDRTVTVTRERPRRIFVNSVSDLFHENVTDEMRDKIFAVMALCPQHVFQVLTKRPERMLRYLTQHKTKQEWADRLSETTDGEEIGIFNENADCQIANAINGCLNPAYNVGWPMRNVWLGVSVENQECADKRIPVLLKTPAAVRYVSCEPLLGELDLSCIPFPADFRHAVDGPVGDGFDALRFDDRNSLAPLRRLDWVICGGESGPGARPMHPDWALSLLYQCQSSGVPFFFKQWGEWTPDYDGDIDHTSMRIDLLGRDVTNLPGLWSDTDAEPYRLGKKAAGSLIAGKEYKAFPVVRA